MKKNDVLALVGFVALCLAVGGASGYFTAAGVGTWFDGLNKPNFNPPKWVFGPVWTTLYLLMSIAAFLVWRRVGFWTSAIALFFVQLTLNFFWSFIFFKAHLLGLALLDIIAMWLAIAATIWAFSKIDRRAAWLLAPYLAWVSFAGVLNAAFWRLNEFQHNITFFG